MNTNLIAGMVARLDAKSDRRRAVAEQDAEKLDHALAALRLATLAEQFKAGDFDADLMARYSAMVDDPEYQFDFAIAADELLSEIGFSEQPETADDFLTLLIAKVESE